MRSIYINEMQDIQAEDSISMHKLLCDEKNLNIDLGEIFSIYLFYEEYYELYFNVETLKKLRLYDIGEKSNLKSIHILSSNYIIEMDDRDYITIFDNNIQSKSLLLASSPRNL